MADEHSRVGYTMRVRELLPERSAADRQVRDALSQIAVEHDAWTNGSLADALFREQRAETFRDGYVFRPGLNLKGVGGQRPDWGHWACDIADHDRLSWSDSVYHLFGLPAGVHVDREWAVGRYLVHSRTTLERVRGFALRHACGFILDAEIEPEGAGRRWIRVLAVPIFENGRVVRLHGLKRGL